MNKLKIIGKSEKKRRFFSFKIFCDSSENFFLLCANGKVMHIICSSSSFLRCFSIYCMHKTNNKNFYQATMSHLLLFLLRLLQLEIKLNLFDLIHCMKFHFVCVCNTCVLSLTLESILICVWMLFGFHRSFFLL